MGVVPRASDGGGGVNEDGVPSVALLSLVKGAKGMEDGKDLWDPELFARDEQCTAPRKGELGVHLYPELFARDKRCATPRKRELGVHL